MTPETDSRVREIAEAACRLETGEREAFLERVCASDLALRREVESRLARHGAEAPQREHATPTTGPPLASLLGADTAGFDPAQRLVGRTIGHYSIKRIIASGGMGTVYEAVQEQPRRAVALKVMKAGIASRAALRRFEYEAQVLARLRHPGIAQIFEAGTHTDEGAGGGGGGGGVPFFAMEYVPGAQPLNVYAEDKRLSTHQRLELFLKVCEAVEHGHSKGIIHRDLKPTNILVDSSGQPKIIDFGVARATDSDMAVTTLQTDVGALIGTLQYMSPEQCAADPHDLDTRSDVYSLGVVLYELLCGRWPYEVSKAAIHEAARVIREVAPARPSTINRALRGDVETITLKALEKDRQRRYRSAADLGDDVQRYLRQEPINARPPSLVYHVRMLARKHRAGLAVLVLVLLLTVSGAAAGWQLVRQLRRSRSLAAEAQQLKLLLESDANTTGYIESPEDRLVRAKLEVRRVSVDTAGKSLREVLDELSARTEVPIYPDWAQLERVNVLQTSPVRASLLSLSGEGALAALLASLGTDDFNRPSYTVHEGAVRISTNEALRRLSVSASYEIRDLTAGADQAEKTLRLKEIIIQTVDPEGWVDNGGETGRAEMLGDRLVITNTRDAHRQIVKLLQVLRGKGIGPDSEMARNARASGSYVEPEEDRAVRNLLSVKRISIDFDGKPLDEVLAYFGDETGAPIFADWVALEAIDIKKSTPVRADIRSLSAEAALAAALNSVGDGFSRAGFNVHEGAVRVSSEEALRRRRLTLTYDVRDLVGTGTPEAGQRLIDIIVSTVDTEGWVDNGGETGTIRIVDDRLLVTNTRDNHQRLIELLQLLRAKGIGPDSEMARNARGAGTYVEPEEDRAVRTMLGARKVSVDFDGGHLERVLTYFRELTGAPIFADWGALEAIGISKETPVRADLRGLSAEAALAAALNSVGDGSSRAGFNVYEGAVRVSSEEALRRRRLTLTYDVRDLVGTGTPEAGQRLIDIIVSTVDTEGWVDNGGETGTIRIVDDRLLVTNTRDNHQRLIELLQLLRSPGVSPDGESERQLGPRTASVQEAVRVFETLERTRRTIDFRALPLEAVLQNLSNETGVVFNVDWQGLAACDVDRNTLVTLRMSSCSIVTALELVLGQIGHEGDRPAFDVYESSVLVARNDAIVRQLTCAIYDLRPLLTRPASSPAVASDQPAAGSLVPAIQIAVDPWAWADNGGQFALAHVLSDGRLVVKATIAIHAGVQRFLAELRSGGGATPGARVPVPDGLIEATAAALRAAAWSAARTQFARAAQVPADWRWRWASQELDQSVGCFRIDPNGLGGVAYSPVARPSPDGRLLLVADFLTGVWSASIWDVDEGRKLFSGVAIDSPFHHLRRIPAKTRARSAHGRWRDDRTCGRICSARRPACRSPSELRGT